MEDPHPGSEKCFDVLHQEQEDGSDENAFVTVCQLGQILQEVSIAASRYGTHSLLHKK